MSHMELLIHQIIWLNGMTQPSYNWKHVAETAGKRILAKNPNLLIVVEVLRFILRRAMTGLLLKSNGQLTLLITIQPGGVVICVEGLSY